MGATHLAMNGRYVAAFDRVFRPGGDGRIFYGWKIVAAGSVTQLLVAGLFLHAYGAYIVLLHRDLGWSVTLLSAGYAMARTESAVLGPLQGHMVDRWGARAVMHIGVVSLGIGLFLMGSMHAIWQFFTAMVFLALGSSFCGFVSLSSAVVNWFRRRRVTALGFSSIGFALGGLLVPVVAALLNAFGWRAVAFGSGVTILLVGPPLVHVVRHHPSELNLYEDGIVPEQLPPASETSTTSAPIDTTRPSISLTARQAMRTSAFWYLSLGHALAVMLVSALMVHLVPHLTTEFGYTLGAAGAVVAILTTVQILGMTVGGMVGDRLDKRTVAVATMIMHGSAALVLSIAVSPLLIGCFVLLHGLAWGARGPLMQAWRSDLFGNTSFGTILGYSSLIVMLGSASGPLLAGALFDRLGSYTAALRILAAFAALSLVMFALVRPPRSVTPALADR